MRIPPKVLPTSHAVEPERVVYNTLRGTEPADLLDTGGRQLIGYTIEYDKLDPWAGIADDAFRNAIGATLTAAGLDELVTAHSLDRVPGRAHAVLTLKSSPTSDVEIYERFHRAWPHDQLAMPSLALSFDPFMAPGPGITRSSYLLEQLLEVRTDGQLDIRAVSLSREARGALTRWAKSVTGRDPTSPERALVALLRSSTDLATPAGRLTAETMRAIDLFSPFWGHAFTALTKRFPPGHARQAQYLYNGHATFHIASLLPTLRAFGAERVNTWISNRSCSPEGRAILTMQNKPEHVRYDTVLQKTTSTFASSSARAETRRTERNIGFLDYMDYMIGAVGRGEGANLVVDKIGPWLERHRGELPAALTNGRVRAVVHNRDDLTAMGDKKDRLWGVDLAGSLLKKLEARFIGEQNALIAAREARKILKQRIGDTPVVIVGFGLLGEQVARALARMGMRKDNITVRDTSPEVMARAKKLGFATELATPDERPKKAVVFVATPGAGVHKGNAHDFADEALVIALTSGGKGVALGDLVAASEMGIEEHEHRNSIKDTLWDVTLGLSDKAGRMTKLTVFAEGQLANLADNMWHDRFQVTSVGVSLACLQAAGLERAGVEPLDPELDRAFVRMSFKNGLWKLRPLDPRDGDDPQALADDLLSFTPSPRARAP